MLEIQPKDRTSSNTIVTDGRSMVVLPMGIDICDPFQSTLDKGNT